MKTRYQLRTLSQRDQEFHQAVLMDELEMQTWFTISFSALMDTEVFLSLQ